MNKPLVSVIVLTYGSGWGVLSKCLESLSKMEYKNTEIIVVDNASSDNTLSEISNIKSQISNLKLIRNNKNVGFAKGNNQAVQKASGEYCLFLNNDTEVSPNFLGILVSALEKNKDIGVIQPKIRQLRNKELLDACASFLANTGFLYHYGYSQNHNKEQYNKKIDMYSVKGACFLTRKKLIDEIGLFDDDYFAYFEETDFCHRVWLSGLKVSYEPKSEIFHLGGPDKEVAPKIVFHSYKNRIQTYLKNFELRTAIRILIIHILISVLVSFAYLIKGKFGYSGAIIRALFWNLVNIFKILEKRKIIQGKVRKISDDKFLPKITKEAKLSYYKHFFFNPRGYYDFEEI